MSRIKIAGGGGIVHRASKGILLVALLLINGAGRVIADDAEAKSRAFFENSIRPLLIQRCIKCHGA